MPQSVSVDPPETLQVVVAVPQLAPIHPVRVEPFVGELCNALLDGLIKP